MTEITEEQIANMRRMARGKAYRVARDDVLALADDLEIAGWIGWLESAGLPEALRWEKAKYAMVDAWCQWKFGVYYSERIFNGSQKMSLRERKRRIPLQGLDLAPLAALQCSVEEQVYGCEIWRGMEREFAKLRKNKLTKTLEDLIKNGLVRGRAAVARECSKVATLARRNKLRDIYRRVAVIVIAVLAATACTQPAQVVPLRAQSGPVRGAGVTSLVPGTAMTYTDGTNTWAGNPFCNTGPGVLQPTSPAIDFGVVVPGLHCPQPGSAINQPRMNDSFGSYCLEWYGKAPDAGACEFVPQVAALVAPSGLVVK